MACTTACSPDPHTRLTVSPGTSTGTPALSAACRATFMPAPAWSTQPITTSPMSAAFTSARAIASRIATAPRSAADRSLNTPPNAPIGVRHALTITVSKSLMLRLYVLRFRDFWRVNGRLLPARSPRKHEGTKPDSFSCFCAFVACCCHFARPDTSRDDDRRRAESDAGFGAAHLARRAPRALHAVRAREVEGQQARHL